MKVKLIIISIILLLVIVFACGCIPFMEKIGLINPTNEEQLSPEKGGPPDGLVKVLIGFKEKPGAAQQTMVRGLGGKIKYTYNIIPAIAASVPEVAIEALKKNPNITNVELDSMVFALDTELDNSWGVKRIGAGIVHESGKNGEGIKIAIIDTGIDKDHPDLNDNLVNGVNFVSKPSWRTPDPNEWDDDNGHGTHVAGIIAAEDNNTGVVGVAPGAALYALKVLDRTGSGYVSDVVAAIQWATENDIQVINMSLGGAYDIWLDAACWLAYYYDGLILVAAAGNGGSVIYPAAYDSVIAVSATNSADELAWFSSTGPEVELAAPGVDIYSTYKDGGYATYSGTSMASPHVAGVAALVIASGTTGVSGVREKLQTTAEDLGAEGRDSQFGYGLVDAAEAVGITSADNLGPVTSGVVADPNPTNDAASVTLTADVSDATTGNSNIAVAEYFVDTVEADGVGTSMNASDDGAFNSPTEVVTASIDVSGWAVGQYTLYVHGMDTAGNWGATESVVLNITEESSNIMYVESITFSAKKAGKNLFLYTTVDVSLKDNGAVDGARVTMTLTNGTSSWNFSGDTGLDGTVKFTLKAQAGNYTTKVTDVSHTEYDWDGGVITKYCILDENGGITQW